MAVRPSTTTRPITETSSNNYNVPTYLGYIIASPTASAVYRLPPIGTTTTGAPVTIVNNSSQTISLQDSDSNPITTIYPGQVANYIQSSSGWLNLSPIQPDVVIPDDLQVAGYLSVGSSTAPSNTTNGAINTIAANPAPKILDDVTADGPSGLLTFTTTLGPTSSVNIIVTNSSVRASSLVFAQLQSYSGNLFANGLPVVDVNGKINGSFTLQIANIHEINSLSGTLTIGFWVLN